MNAHLTAMYLDLFLLMLMLTIEFAALLSPKNFNSTFIFKSLNIVSKYKAFRTADVKALIAALVVERDIV